MPAVQYALPAKPWLKPRPIKSLLDVQHEAQKAGVATMLNVPFTPRPMRNVVCMAALAFDTQVQMNEHLSRDPAPSPLDELV